MSPTIIADSWLFGATLPYVSPTCKFILLYNLSSPCFFSLLLLAASCAIGRRRRSHVVGTRFLLPRRRTPRASSTCVVGRRHPSSRAPISSRLDKDSDPGLPLRSLNPSCLPRHRCGRSSPHANSSSPKLIPAAYQSCICSPCRRRERRSSSGGGRLARESLVPLFSVRDYRRPKESLGDFFFYVL